MIELPVSLFTADRRWPRWFPPGAPGPAVLAEHVRATQVGHCWADRTLLPRTIAVASAGHALLCGDPQASAPEELAPLAHSWVVAPPAFLPVLAGAFDRLVPWERMVWVNTDPAGIVPVPAGVGIRRLHAADGPALHGFDGDDLGWIADSWGGPLAATASGHCWGAIGPDGRLLSVACTYFLGSRYEEIAVVTVPDQRGRGLALACVAALCGDITARGHVASWTCSRDNRPSRRLAWRAGFRLAYEYVHYVTGAPVTRPLAAAL